MAQTLKDYDQNEAYRLAAEKIGYGQTAPTYQGTYENQLNDLYDKIANREKFSYDVNADPLYDLYKDKYIQGGKLAMKDTMGQAAALTGGYGNTYGQQVGQQAYDAYLQNLSAVIPQLYGMAYDKWRDEGDDLKDLYGMVGARRDTEYGQWRDLMNDYNVNRSLVQQQEATDYGRLLADDEREYERGLEADKTAYERQRQAYTNLMALIQASGYIPTDEELAAAGVSREAAEALRNEYLRQIALQGGAVYGGGGGGGGSPGGGSSKSGGGSSGGGGYYGGGGSAVVLPEGMSPGDYITLQQAANDAVLTRSQVMNMVNDYRDQMTPFEAMDTVYSMISSGHSGSTPEGRAAEEEYIQKRNAEEKAKKEQANTDRSAAAAGWGDTTKKLKELGIIK